LSFSVLYTGKATFYIGFDCTADSLTAGHFMALTLMKRLQMAGQLGEKSSCFQFVKNGHLSFSVLYMKNFNISFLLQ